MKQQTAKASSHHRSVWRYPLSMEHVLQYEIPSELLQAEGVLSALASIFFPTSNAFDPTFDLTINDEESGSDLHTEWPDAAARYRILVEQIPAVVFMAFFDKGIGEAYISPQIEALLGFTQEEWLDDPVAGISKFTRTIKPAGVWRQRKCCRPGTPGAPSIVCWRGMGESCGSTVRPRWCAELMGAPGSLIIP